MIEMVSIQYILFDLGFNALATVLVARLRAEESTWAVGQHPAKPGPWVYPVPFPFPGNLKLTGGFLTFLKKVVGV